MTRTGLRHSQKEKKSSHSFDDNSLRASFETKARALNL